MLNGGGLAKVTGLTDTIIFKKNRLPIKQMTADDDQSSTTDVQTR